MTMRFWTAGCLAAVLAALLLSAPGPARAQALDQGLAAIESLAGEVDTAREQVEQARRVWETVRGGAAAAGTTEEAAKAEEELTKAKAGLQQAEGNLDQARVDHLAKLAGVSPEQITAMRESGKGWGVIAKELGLPASTLGKGKAFRNQAASGTGAGDGTQGKGQNKAKSKNKDKGKGKKGKGSETSD